MSSLLADIVASRNLQPEPVATDALVALLSRSPAGRDALTKYVSTLSALDIEGSLTFTAQVTDADASGRPDIVGSDLSGPRLVLEAKFDAELTEIQRTTAYEQRLASGAPGVLMFLVPRDRLSTIWAQLLEGPASASVAPVPWSQDAPHTVVQLLSGNLVAATSWEHLLAVMRDALTAAHEVAPLADLAQIEGLVAWRGRVGWTPLVGADLPARTGRQLAGLIPAVLAAAQQASVAKTRNGSGDQGAGRYITTPGGHTMWVGVWLSWWGRFGASPAWAQIKTAKTASADLIAECLSGVPHVLPRPASGDVLVPLLVPRGAELDAVTSQIASQVLAIAEALDQLTGPVTTEDEVTS